jgi:branched-subunit amino acid permease
MYLWVIGLLLGIGVYFLLKGSLEIFSVGKRTINTDPRFVRASGLMILVAVTSHTFTENNSTMMNVLLVLAAVTLIIAMVRGVKR